MNTEFEKILIDSLDALDRGDSIAAVLSRYPGQEETLRPFLETAALFADLNLQPSLAAQSRSKQAFLGQANALRPRPTGVVWWRRWQRALVPAFALLVIFLLFSAALLPLSANAMPGDALYSVKRLAENGRLAATGSADRKLELIERYKETRRLEIQQILAANQDIEGLVFEGIIETMDETNWQVSGLTVQIAATTQIVGKPQMGLLAIVNGRTRQGAFIAQSILIPGEGMTLFLPTPTQTPSATSTHTAVPSATLTPTPTQTLEPTATHTPSPTVTHTPSPTATRRPPTATPTATAVPAATITNTPVPQPTSDDNSNDNSNDNSDDSDDNDNHDNSNDNDSGGDNDNNDNHNAND